MRFFALYRERAGTSEQTLEVRERTTVADLLEMLRELYPNLAPPSARITAAINSEYAEEDIPLTEGDELALIPPVSGGYP